MHAARMAHGLYTSCTVSLTAKRSGTRSRMCCHVRLRAHMTTSGAWDIWYLEAESKGAPGRGQEPQPADRASLRGRAPYLKLLLGAEDGSFAMGAEGSCPLKHMRVSVLECGVAGQRVQGSGYNMLKRGASEGN